MRCSTDFQPDFFNNVAAVAVVLMFTKVVTHRSSKRRRGRLLAVVHATAVLGACAAVIASLWATEMCSRAHAAHVVAWVGLGAAGVALLVDVCVDDVGRTWAAGGSRSRNSSPE